VELMSNRSREMIVVEVICMHHWAIYHSSLWLKIE